VGWPTARVPRTVLGRNCTRVDGGFPGSGAVTSLINCRLRMIDCNNEDAIGVERIATVARPYEDWRMWCGV
jgi:hypothetical protein